MSEVEMKKIFVNKVTIPLVILLLLFGFWGLYKASQKQEKVSEFGKYQGYSEELFDGSKRTSDYLTLSDGTRLAYDLFLPTKNGIVADQPLPVLFKYTPYGRAWTVFDKDGKAVACELYTVWNCELMLRFRAWVMPHGSGKIKDAINRTPWLGEMLNSGYAAIVVDRPGTGASFGVFNGAPEIVVGETNEILNWIAAQPWSDGNIGMFGDSIQAQIQFRAASTGNPHLKAILPATTWMDNYSSVMFPGGILDKAMAGLYVKANDVFDAMATPVDQDTDGVLLAQARAERNANVALSQGVAQLENFPYRDSLAMDGQNYWSSQTLYPLLERINSSGTPVYLINGWYDIYARDNFLIYNNLTVPKHLLVRPTDHAGIEESASDIDYGAEAHRWFDYWLKGIDNGIMDEPPIHYYLQGAGKTQTWQSTDVWPLNNQAMTRYYFAPSATTGKASINNGTLIIESPTTAQAFDAYTVDYSTTTGTSPLWTGLAVSHKYPNMRSNDATALTYTTLLLETAITVTGHPIVHIWLTADVQDLDAFVYLEEVDSNGNSTYITEGELRASHRTLSLPPFENFGLPWRNHFESEIQPIPKGEPFELVFDMRPTAWQFSAGKQIRITVTFADAGNFDTPILNPAPTLQLLRDAGHPSYVDLPIVQYP
jgi:uncharacterized protein